ncbi:MAG: hypothetical protein DSZ29_05760 [Aquificaceae bacterium]|nr:MAG: hypothetical protein DSZ29_05760 [Aquificaceae bacterium]
MQGFSRLFTIVFISIFLFSACNKEAKQTTKDTHVVAPSSETKHKASEEEVATTQNDTKQDQVEFNWLKLSGWHTQGAISRNSPVRIVFNREVIGDDLVGKDASRVMKISPSISGKPIFESKTEIVWLPKKSLTPATEYKVSIKANGLKDVPLSTKDYEFSFRVLPMEYEITTDPLAVATGDRTLMILSGQVLVSDRVLPDDVRKVLKARYHDKPVKITWQHSDNGKQHRFIIKELKRDTFASDLQLSWTGKSLGIATKGSKEITIPALNDFKMIDVRVKHSDGENSYVQINFSDPLETSQNLKGLIQLEKQKYKIRTEDNIIKLYPNESLSGEHKLIINKGLKSATGGVLNKSISKKVTFDAQKPQVRFVGSGSILPENGSLEVPFEAVGIDSIKVSAFEIYPDNMGQFLQVNNLNGNEETGRVGRFLWQKNIPLSSADPNKWNRYSFDVTELMKDHEGGLVRLNLQITRKHSTYRCGNKTKPIETRETLLKNEEDNNVLQPSGWDGVSDFAEADDLNDWSWEQRNNPCTDAYFTFHNDKTEASHNFIVSNIGILAKQDAHEKLSVITTDLNTSKPLAGVDLVVRNYQGQVLAKGRSDAQGFASLTVLSTPFLLTATKDHDTNYLKLNAKTALSVSQFNTGGVKVSNGIKGMLYGERGVWRPGDDIYLTFVLEDKDNKIPDAHPVTMKLIDPRGRIVNTQTSSDAVGGFYQFKFKTEEKAETGKWLAKAFLGGSHFSKSLLIETIRPNRLKIDLDFGTDVLHGYRSLPPGTLFAQWLHGATAENLKADISVRFKPKKTSFDSYTDFNFDDPVRRLKSADEQLLKGRLDSTGKLRFTKFLHPSDKPAGKLRATFTSRVFEQSGAFSINRRSLDYHPYKEYLGIKLPKGDEARGMLLTDKKHSVQIASINADGKPVSMQKVQVTLYKIDWKWWWDKSSESLAEYDDSQHHNKLKQDIISTTDGHGVWQFEIKYPEWGRYLVRACDLDGGHCTGKTVYIDWPGWAGRAQEEGSGSASRLNIFADKPAYTVGETATIKLPKTAKGRALLSVETASRILTQKWIEFTGERSKFELPISAEMSPNVYVHITLLQPHKGKENDRPLRLYGIIPLEVADPKTYLKPLIKADNEWKPDSTQTISVSEENGKAMTYTLAIVDEGLLGLTSFKTPDLHRHFYRKEALGIKTWDLYDQVVGAYSGNLNKMIALGGGDEGNIDNDSDKKRRFPPIVKVLGPFHLAAGKTAQHEITLPPYIGAVRAMLVAGEKGAYGKVSQSIFVRQPLIMQATMPRMLGPNEEVNVPISLFVTEKSIKDVKLEVIVDDFFTVVGEKSKQISFSKTGEKLGMLRLKTNNKSGKGHVQFIATSGQHKSSADIYIDIRQANQETTRTITRVIEPGETWVQQVTPHGIDGSNQATLELSSVPSLNMEKHLDYLVRYPHGCLEQTTSAAFPQLYLSKVMQLSDARQKKIEHHIKQAIERLRSFQLATGNFSYWPNGNDSNEWASIYAGHFLIEAQKLGYLLPAELLSDWLTYQADAAQRWLAGSHTYAQTQAYRLYVLALANKPQMGAMNRLRESGEMSHKARWMLASAYQVAGQSAAANSLIQGLVPASNQPAKITPETFSSTLGDLGLQLSNLVSLNKKQDANLFVEKISAELNRDTFQSTQGLSWALMGVSRYLAGDTSHFNAKLSFNDKDSKEVTSNTPFLQQSLGALEKKGTTLEVVNTNGSKLFASVISRGIPEAGNEKSINKGLKLQLSYRNIVDAKELNLQENAEIVQGSDIAITVDVSNTSNRKVEHIALTLPVAAGWEIHNANYSLKSDKDSGNKIINQFDYQDVRDDRIYTYFALEAKQTKTFRVLINASYRGHYYLPAVSAEAMYDGKMQARQQGQWITISQAKAVTKDPADKDKSAETKKQERSVSVKKAWLYSSPKEEDISKQYLIEGDKFIVLDEKVEAGKTWYLIHFIGVKIVEKWIKATDTKAVIKQQDAPLI